MPAFYHGRINNPAGLVECGSFRTRFGRLSITSRAAIVAECGSQPERLELDWFTAALARHCLANQFAEGWIKVSEVGIGHARIVPQPGAVAEYDPIKARDCVALERYDDQRSQDWG
jgi:hypothetical protein